MIVTIPSVLTTFEAWAKACNERRYEDIAQYLHNPIHHSGRDFTPEEWVEYLVNTQKVIGPNHSNIDYVAADDEQQCLTCRLRIKCRPAKSMFGFEPPGRDIYFAEQSFIWFTDGKISSTSVNFEKPAVLRQLADPKETYRFDSAKVSEVPEHKLSGDQMIQVFKGFIELYNTRNFDDLSNVLQSEVIVKGAKFELAGFRAMMSHLAVVIEGLTVTIKTIILDTRYQRISAQTEWAGTPVHPIEGLDPTGRSISVDDHICWEFEGGKLHRLWSELDYTALEKQLRG